MFPVMTQSSKFNGFAFCALLAAMLVYSLPKLLQFSGQQTETWSLFLNGELSRKFESIYDREFFLREGAINGWSNLQYLLFREGSTGVVTGNNNWLFTNEEYLFPVDHQAALAQHVDAIAQVRAVLAAQGKQLVLLPIPMKLDLYREHARIQPDPRLDSVYTDFLAAMQQLQIPTADIRAAMVSGKQQADMFLPRDTHWTPEGARIAAQELVRQQPQLVGDTHYVSELNGTKAAKSDLMNYIRFSPRLAPELFEPQLINQYETLSTAAEVNLFGDTAPALALVGTSYTHIEDWNFPGFLQEALRTELVVMAFEANGPFYAMQQFFQSELSRDAAITTVIWEFPVRTLISRQQQRNNWQANLEQIF